MQLDLPRRWLFVIHTPWSRNLGAPRVQLELGEELQRIGCSWEKFSWENAFSPPRPARSRWAGWLQGKLTQNRNFARQATAFVRANAHRFDVVEGNLTDLPVSKESMKFRGLLVTRSAGFIPAYEAFEAYSKDRWPQQDSLRNRIEKALASPSRARRRRDLRPSLLNADLVNVANRDDYETLSREWALGEKVLQIPIGLSAARLDAFRACRASAAVRLAAQTVVFVGTWNDRKGAHDWPAIVRAIVDGAPSARFRFLGTSLPRERVLEAFGEQRKRIEVTPIYTSDQLPALLTEATVAAFPGYLEGFGISVLETLAAGLPTVIYDATGPREIVNAQERPRKVARGDTSALAASVVDILRADPVRWQKESDDAIRAAGHFNNRDIAHQTLELYGRKWREICR